MVFKGTNIVKIREKEAFSRLDDFFMFGPKFKQISWYMISYFYQRSKDS